MRDYFEKILQSINSSIREMDDKTFHLLLDECIHTLQSGHKIIVSGLGKNVPICEKFVGTMLSLGLNAAFLHTNSAVHGDLGVVHDGDLVLILSKSGETAESIYLVKNLAIKKARTWTITFTRKSSLSKITDETFLLTLDHEGDKWDIVPNNSTTLYLIILQALAIQAADIIGTTLDEFRKNHPGGHIGEVLQNENKNTQGFYAE